MGIQRVLKLSMKRSAHRDIVNEVATQMEAGVMEIKLDTTIKTSRDRAVGWVVNAIHDIDKKELICKVISTYLIYHPFLTVYRHSNFARLETTT